MLFTSEYSMKMPLPEALLTSVVGIGTVMIILAIIAVLIILVSKVIRGFEGVAAKKKAVSVAAAPAVSTAAPTGVIPVAGVSQGTIDLVNVDEKTAAIIMAIVSDKSGIPLNRLSFKSIKLVEEKNK